MLRVFSEKISEKSDKAEISASPPTCTPFQPQKMTEKNIAERCRRKNGDFSLPQTCTWLEHRRKVAEGQILTAILQGFCPKILPQKTRYLQVAKRSFAKKS